MKNKIKVRAVIRCKYRPLPHSAARPLHDHPFYQLIYVATGRSHLLLGDECHEAGEGDIFFLPPKTPHNLRSAEGTITTYEVKLDVGRELANMLATVPLRVTGASPRIRELLQLALDEGLERAPRYREMITLTVEGILYLLARMGEGQDTDKPSRLTADDALIEEVRRHLALHLQDNVTLDALAAHFSMTSEYLCRRFSAVVGLSPIRYLNALRLERSRELLAETDMTVTEIADAMGYSGIHYFSRAFKRAVGMSPQAYRERCKDQFCVTLD